MARPATRWCFARVKHTELPTGQARFAVGYCVKSWRTERAEPWNCKKQGIADRSLKNRQADARECVASNRIIRILASREHHPGL